MAKKKEKEYFYKDLKVKSKEELFFIFWLEKLKENGFILNWKYEPQYFVLSEKKTYKTVEYKKTKIKYNDTHLLKKTIYTPDFLFNATEKFMEINHNLLIYNIPENFYCGKKSIDETQLKFFIDTKGTFNRFKSNSDFSLRQRWLYDRYGYYVNKVEIDELFKNTFVPELCRYTPKKGDIVKKYIVCATEYEFFKKFN